MCQRVVKKGEEGEGAQVPGRDGGGESIEKQRDPSTRHLSSCRLYPKVMRSHRADDQESSSIR